MRNPLTNHPAPPMLPTIHAAVEMGMQTLPVEHRDPMRALIRAVTAQAWQDGRLCALAEAATDRPARTVEGVEQILAIWADAKEQAALFGDVFLRFTYRGHEGRDHDVALSVVPPEQVTLHAEPARS